MIFPASYDAVKGSIASEQGEGLCRCGEDMREGSWGEPSLMTAKDILLSLSQPQLRKVITKEDAKVRSFRLVKPPFSEATVTTTTSNKSTNIDDPATPPMSVHKPGEDIRTKHKEAMRQLFKFAEIEAQDFRIFDTSPKNGHQYSITSYYRLYYQGCYHNTERCGQ